MLENILPEFQKFLTSCGIADKKHAPFYARWEGPKDRGQNFSFSNLTFS